jgi:hypothetical protein
MQDFIEEKEVTLQLLEELFQHARYEASINDDGNFMVLAETALVSVDVLTGENQRFIRFTSMYKMREGIQLDQKIGFANRLNNQVILSRFSILETDYAGMNVEYFLPFWGGISSYHIVAAFRMFVYVYTSVPSAMDSENLIEYGTYPQLTAPLNKH